MSGSFLVPHDLAAPIAGTASGPLAGLTAVVKDMYDIAGTRTGGGSPEWLAAQQPAKRHAAAVEKILAAGATITGKTICDEFFYSVTGVNAHYGAPTNIRAPGRVPGGSSSGSAAACGANACDFALGSDTGGSVRIPASFNGLYGLRPTHGRVDLAGAMAMAPSFDVGGWFANGPGVFRRVGAVLLQGAAVAAPVARLLVARDAFAEADAEVAALGREFLARAAPHLPSPAEETVAPAGLDAWREAFRVAQAKEVWETYGAFVARAKPKLGPGIKERMEFAASVTADEAADARKIAAAARAHVRALMPPGTILALPTAPAIAPLLSAPSAELEQFRIRTFRMTCIAGLAGLPQMNLPVGTVSGYPAGFSFIGWAGGDEVLLELACRLARFCGIS
ncbi:MAG TPA: amidase [Xanthobacteraceae bacterium]|nr:amidase [Xanthobacteraceae bacterium]